MASSVREPIQVYLSADERAALDRAAAGLGVSRSEVLRRGIQVIARRPVWRGALADLVDAETVLPPTDRSGTPPPSIPVAGSREILTELAEDREGR